MAATCDGELFALLEQAPLTTTGILPPELLEQVIVRALQIKLSVVEQDPTEKGLRRILNFGHTVGHAIESLHGVALLHGECVALGMLPMSSSDARARLQSILARYGLPTRITDPAEQLLPYILHDKKRQKDGVAGVLVEEIGSCHVCTLSPEALTERIKEAENA